MSSYLFQGWLGHSPEAADGKMEWDSFEPKIWTEDDVDIEITHCGICGSDIHTLRSDWGGTCYPCCVGHEIVGKAVRVGQNVSGIRVGDRVGVGAQARSCLECEECLAGRQQYCRKELIATYGFNYPSDEGKSYGGFADYNRTNGRFVVKIPDGLPSELAAPMLCSGITMFSPLQRNKCGPGKHIGIVGIGGLGHLGILFAKALGADTVIALSRGSSKRDELLRMGADRYIATDEDQNWHVDNAYTLDMIICTISSDEISIDNYLSLLKTGGVYIQVGLPTSGLLPTINAYALMRKELKIQGGLIGSPEEIVEMLQFAAEKHIKPWVETRPLDEANQAIIDMGNGKARYKYVLVNRKHTET